MHCRVVFFLFSLIAIGVFCADWDIFQDNGFAPSDTTLALSDTRGLDLFNTNEDPSTKLNLDDLSTAPNQEDSYTLFDSGDSNTSFNPADSSNLLASVDDACSLPPARRMRARADGGTSCSNFYNSNNGNLPSLSSDVLLDNSLQIPRYGRKITDYENSDQRLMGQTYCPSHQIVLPGLILPVCSSGIPGFTQNMLMDVLYTVFNGFLMTIDTAHLCKSPREPFCCASYDDSIAGQVTNLQVTFSIAGPCEKVIW